MLHSFCIKTNNNHMLNNLLYDFENSNIGYIYNIGVEYDGVRLQRKHTSYYLIEAVVPKGISDYSKLRIVQDEYILSATIQRNGTTNIFKVVLSTTEGEVITYLILDEENEELNNNTTVVIGTVDPYNLSENEKEENIHQIVRQNSINVAQTTIESDSEYYDETIDNYYIARDIKVNLSHHLYILENNKYQIINVDAENVLYEMVIDDYYVFNGDMNDTDNYVIVDVVSSDRTTKTRYIIEFEKNAE